MYTFAQPKDPVERVVLTFDFLAAGDIEVGETLTAIDRVTVRSEEDADAEATLLNGAPALATDLCSVRVPVKGGVVGARYRIKVECPTSNPAKYCAMTGVLAVEEGA